LAVDHGINERINTLNSRINELEASLSPFIRIGNQIRLLRAQGLVVRSKIITKKVVRLFIARLVKLVGSFPRIKGTVVKIAQKTGIYDRLQRYRREVKTTLDVNKLNDASSEEVSQALKDMPLEVRQAFKELNTEIKKQEQQ
jgi:BMFP domain-containing protein YqiC